MKTARFKSVVEACGKPGVHVTWLKPAKDPVLQAALKQNRVMTLHQPVRSGAHYGTVGFMKSKQAQLLLFPKSLRRFEALRIVGIDYALLDADGATSVSIEAWSAPVKKTAGFPKLSFEQKAAELRAFTAASADEPADTRSEDSPVTRPKHVRTTSVQPKPVRAEPTPPPPAPPPLPPLPEEYHPEINGILRDLKNNDSTSARRRLRGLLKTR